MSGAYSLAQLMLDMPLAADAIVRRVPLADCDAAAQRLAGREVQTASGAWLRVEHVGAYLDDAEGALAEPVAALGVAGPCVAGPEHLLGEQLIVSDLVPVGDALAGVIAHPADPVHAVRVPVAGVQCRLF